MHQLKKRRLKQKNFMMTYTGVYDRNSKNEYLILAGDFNARVGAQPIDKFIGSE
jgi:hypothetical protein